MARHVGIMGGTFNPIHIGHLIVAQEALVRYDFDMVYFIPNQIPPHRQLDPELAGGEDRYIMVNLATATNPRFLASRMEIDHRGVSYTLETVKTIKEKHPSMDVTFITGVDSILKDRWCGFDELLGFLKYFVCATRPGFDENLLEKRLDSYELGHRGRVALLKIPGVDISSTLIRRRVKEGKPIKYMVTGEVESFIYKKHLYMGD